MRLVEFGKTLPKKAGVVALKFTKNERVPKRKEAEIVIPDHGEVEFFPLSNGDQFLLALGNDEGGAWFGGTDENPFLSHLSFTSLEVFHKDGEDAFYQWLKPKGVIKLEEGFRVRAKRQGDFFFVPSPLSFEEWEALADCNGALRSYCEYKRESSLRLIGTRHVLQGRALRTQTISAQDGKWRSARPSCYDEPEIWSHDLFLVSGVVTAPDHKPLELKEPHFVFQADGFFSEEVATKAD